MYTHFTAKFNSYESIAEVTVTIIIINQSAYKLQACNKNLLCYIYLIHRTINSSQNVL